MMEGDLRKRMMGKKDVIIVAKLQGDECINVFCDGTYNLSIQV